MVVAAAAVVAMEAAVDTVVESVPVDMEVVAAADTEVVVDSVELAADLDSVDPDLAVVATVVDQVVADSVLVDQVVVDSEVCNMHIIIENMELCFLSKWYIICEVLHGSKD